MEYIKIDKSQQNQISVKTKIKEETNGAIQKKIKTTEKISIEKEIENRVKVEDNTLKESLDISSIDMKKYYPGQFLNTKV